MDSEDFTKLCRQNLVDLCNRKMSSMGGKSDFKGSDFYVVWSSKTLQNNKAMMSTDAVAGLYFELTYSGGTKSMYVDVYERRENVCFKE